ncbi:putative glycosyl hydrolase [Alternaria alternata]|uniref:Mannan endo-1,6-alpha-mannosidase n=1 Tax=Alternaria tenuissima TaxID=119927 RepID=A0A4Q4M2L0_9PLEO|nr:putative glycosyl hydrolase [Alternaria alternata]RYN32794.1 hypothetical protein AA0114_g12044 [Alternaria tenuissima]
MFASVSVLSLALSCIVSTTAALDLDVQNKDSIILAAQALAGGIVKFYNDSLSEDGIPGLFPDPYFWYEGGMIFNALIDYSYLTGDKQYDSIVSEGIQGQLGDHPGLAFFPDNQTAQITNDDQSLWALAAMAAAESDFPKPENQSWVKYAAQVFDAQVLRWDDKSCNGGLRWTIFTFQAGYDYKSGAANGDFFLLAARLAKFTGNETYSEWADKSFTWAKDIGIINDEYAVFDGGDATDDCRDINGFLWTNLHAAYTEGSAIMQNITNGKQKWTDALQGLVNSSAIFFQQHDVLTEIACETTGKCDVSMRAYKGMAISSYARAVVAAPIIAEPLMKKLEVSAQAAAGTCGGDFYNVQCSLDWANSTEGMWEAADASDGNLNEVYDALQAVQGLLFSQTTPPNVTSSGNGDNATQKVGASGTSGAGAPKETGAAGTIAASVTMVLAMAFAAALSC